MNIIDLIKRMEIKATSACNQIMNSNVDKSKKNKLIGKILEIFLQKVKAIKTRYSNYIEKTINQKELDEITNSLENL